MNFLDINSITHTFNNIKELNNYLVQQEYKIQLINYIKYCQLKFNSKI